MVVSLIKLAVSLISLVAVYLLVPHLGLPWSSTDNCELVQLKQDVTSDTSKPTVTRTPPQVDSKPTKGISHPIDNPDSPEGPVAGQSNVNKLPPNLSGDKSQHTKQGPLPMDSDTSNLSISAVQLPQSGADTNGAFDPSSLPFNVNEHSQGATPGMDVPLSNESINKNDIHSEESVADLANQVSEETYEPIKDVDGTIVHPPEVNVHLSQRPENGAIESENGVSPVVTSQKQLLDEDEVIIALVGPTGSGKSSFMSKVTGNDGDVGHGLTSCTSELKVARCEEPALSNIVLVDTPGFDDETRTYLEVPCLVSKWLNKRYHKKISAILYFHRITDNRVMETSLKSLQFVKKLCGCDAMTRVFLITTMWDEVDEDVGVERLKELQTTHFKEVVSHGSTPFCYENTPESVKQLLEDVAKNLEPRHVILPEKDIKPEGAKFGRIWTFRRPRGSAARKIFMKSRAGSPGSRTSTLH